jgi:hypothetical protein
MSLILATRQQLCILKVRDSSASIVTDYGLDDWDSIPDRRFSSSLPCYRPVWGPTQPTIQCMPRDSSPWVKGLGRVADHSPLSVSAKDMNAYSFTCFSHTSSKQRHSFAFGTRVEAGSNTSTVTLRVVRGDEMGLKKAAP